MYSFQDVETIGLHTEGSRSGILLSSRGKIMQETSHVSRRLRIEWSRGVGKR